MGEETQFITNLAAAVAIALAGGLLAHRLGQSPIIGYLLAGVLIGPFTPGFIGDREQIAALAEVGIVFLMFALGIEFSLKELAALRGVAIVGTIAQVALTIAAGVSLGYIVGWPLAQGIFFGGVIAISSTMVILRTLIDRGEVASHHGRVLLGMLIVQDLAAVVMIVVLPELTGGGGSALMDGALTLVKAVIFIGVTLVLGARVMPRFMGRIERLESPELFVLTAAALALGTAAVGGLFGLSPALGAFLAGLLLTETEFDHRVIAEVVPMRDIFATLFFVSVGMLIDPWFVINNLPAVLALAAFIMVVKFAITLGVVLPFGIGSKTAVFTALGMSQIGEFSYLLAHAGRDSGAMSESLYALVLTSSLVTIALTPSAFWVAPRVDLALGRLPGIGRRFRPQPTVLADAHALSNHAIVIGFGRVGRRVADGLRDANLPVTVIEDDLHLVQEIRRLGYNAVYGDASYRAIIDAAVAERAKLVVTALPDAGATRAVVLNVRRANPHVPILARVSRSDYDGRVRQAGATAIVAPERAGALMLLEEGARVLGLPPELLTRSLGVADLDSVGQLDAALTPGQTLPEA